MQDSEYNYKLIIENSRDLILIIGLNGVISFANNSWYKKIGYLDSELVGMNIFDLIDYGCIDNCKSHFESVLTGKEVLEMELTIVSKTGNPIYVNVSCSPLYKDGVIIGTQSFFRDITSKKHTESALLESEVKQRKIFESVQDVVYIISSEGKFVSLNPAFEKVSGYKIEEWIGKSFTEMVHPDDLKFSLESFRKIFAGEKVDIYNLRLKRKDGEYLICELTPGALEINGKIVEFLGVARDITQRKRNEDLLKESEERFKLALKGANDGLWDWNLSTNEVYFSPRWKGMLGYEDHELKNDFDTWTMLIHPDDIGQTLLKLDNYLHGKTGDYQTQFRLMHKNGYYVDVLARGYLIKDESGNNLRITGTHVDMTEINVNKIQLQKLIDELSKKYNDLLQFNYIISHNLRTPVASILGLGSILSFDDNTEEEKKKIVDNIVLSTMKIDEVLKDLTNIITIRQPLLSKRTIVNIMEIIQGILEMLKEEIKKSNAILDLDLDENYSTLFTIKGYIESVLFNLISNAIKYSSNNRRPLIKIKSIQSNDQVILSVEDNGIGIDLEKNGANMFGLYKRFNSDSEGRGLGLFMSKNQIEAIGGTINISSQLDVGTVFTIKIPLK
jgi:PAS domain S-box-containing protein